MSDKKKKGKSKMRLGPSALIPEGQNSPLEAEQWLSLDQESFKDKVEKIKLGESKELLIKMWEFFDQFYYIEHSFMQKSVKVAGKVVGGIQIYDLLRKNLGGYDRLLGVKYNKKKEVKKG